MREEEDECAYVHMCVKISVNGTYERERDGEGEGYRDREKMRACVNSSKTGDETVYNYCIITDDKNGYDVDDCG